LRASMPLMAAVSSGTCKYFERSRSGAITNACYDGLWLARGCLCNKRVLGCSLHLKSIGISHLPVSKLHPSEAG
jgi:hypothetical protein